MKKRDINLEQFFTKSDVAKKCIEFLNLNSYDRIIEPSAGCGSFSNQIANCEAYDICPMDNSIKQKNFLEFSTEKGNILVIGNPPFGRQSSTAIKFINNAAKFAKTIAFILPKSFSKESMINKLDEHLELKKVVELPQNSFFFGNENFDIPCSFFIFEYSENKREKFTKYETSDFTFCKKQDADFSIRRVGFYAGKIEGLDVSESSHYFIKDNTGNSINILKKINYTSANNTVGSKSISKNEIVKEYLCQKDKN